VVLISPENFSNAVRRRRRRLVAYYLMAVQCDASWIDPVTRSFLDDIRDSEGLRSMVIAALETNMD
jgi:hypothetical protein